MGLVQNPGAGHPDSGRPPFVNGSKQGGTVQAGTPTQPTRHVAKESSALNGASGNQYKGGGPMGPVRHQGRGGKPLS